MVTLLLCLKVFFARIIDVSLGTLRTLVVVKGKTGLASLIAFFEVMIWFLVAREVLGAEELNIFVAISYSLGFAAGTLIGSVLSKKLIKGTVGVQVVTSRDNNNLIKTIRHEGFAVSVIDLKNDFGKERKEMLFIQVNNKSLNRLLNLIKKLDSTAFVVVNETKAVQNGYVK